MPLHSLRLEMQSLLMNQGACFEFPHAKRRKINLKFNALSPPLLPNGKNCSRRSRRHYPPNLTRKTLEQNMILHSIITGGYWKEDKGTCTHKWRLGFFLVLATFNLFVQEKKRTGTRHACLMLLVLNTLEKLFRNSSSLKLRCKTISHWELTFSVACIFPVAHHT